MFRPILAYQPISRYSHVFLFTACASDTEQSGAGDIGASRDHECGRSPASAGYHIDRFLQQVTVRTSASATTTT